MLGGVRVVDLVGGIAGGYCTKLLADAGADVVVVEPPGGAASRRAGPPGLFEFLHTSKRSVTAGTEGPLVAAADVVVAGAGFDVAAARRDAPGLVVVTITPVGEDGPWAGRPANEFVLQAACGSTGGRGVPGETPLSAGGSLGEWLAGTYAAAGAVAAWLGASRTGRGERVDVSMLDCMAVGMVTFPSVFADFAAAAGRPPAAAAMRRIEVPSVEPASDGWVNFTTNTAQQFSDFCALIGRPELAADRRFSRHVPRFGHRREFAEITEPFTSRLTTAELIDKAALLRIPVAPVLDERSVLAFDHFVERGVFVENPSGGFRQPRVPYRLHGTEPPAFSPVPGPGQHDGAVDWPARARRPPSGPGGLPLEGVRVVDMTAWWAGPGATHVLACLGADVVKVESTVRPDQMRFAGPKLPGDDQWWEWGPMAHAVNTNKRGIAVDLTRPEGIEVALALFDRADLVFENFTPRVLDQFGLGWERLHARNRGLSLVRMPAFGLDGPWRDRPGFAQTMEAVSGLAAATGWPGGPPVLVGGAGDPIAGLHAAFAAMVALAARHERGHGHLVEATMIEAVLNVAAAAPLAHQLTGRTAGRRGNRSLGGPVPQGVYPCGGEDRWIAVSVRSDAEWLALTGVVGTPAPGEVAPGPTEAALGSAAGRRANEDGLDRWLAERTAAFDPADLADRLAAAGVPAAVVVAPPEGADNPQVRHRGLFEAEDHPVTGRRWVPGLPLAFERVAGWVRTPSPLLGQHNDEVLAEVGIAPERRRALRDLGVIGERPVGA
jgi:crotonobetainyl-CoA:carnitine CoA-transferase CaiB-like acyl-CoA transferase